MNYSERAHKTFIENVSNKKSVEFIKSKSSELLNSIELGIKLNIFDENPTNREFFKSLLIEGENYYIMTDESKNSVVFYKKNLLGMMEIGYYTPENIVKDFYNGVPKVLELLHIHSLKRGEGYKMMQSLFNLSKKLKLDIVLWTETEKNTSYFENLGFESLGPLGENNENLMRFKYLES